ncbi:MAG: YraN family protein [Halieaceae bacterium]|nr:YraN family protein [Halieaceae bacterium]
MPGISMKQLGDEYERRAAHFLSLQGVEVFICNYRCRCGEIDLIARQNDYLVFIEVRARRNPRFATAAASVDYRKQQRLLRTAQFFLQRHTKLANLPCRFDVITFEPRQSTANDSPQWIRGAFTN